VAKFLFLVVFGLFSSTTFISGAAISEVRCSTDMLGRKICKDSQGGTSVFTPDQLGGGSIRDNNGDRTRCFKDPMGTLICR